MKSATRKKKSHCPFAERKTRGMIKIKIPLLIKQVITDW